MTKLLIKALAVLTVCGAPGVAQAQISGSIDAQINLSAGCVINGDGSADGASGADFGTLDFGNQPTNFQTVDGEVIGTGAGITVQCTASTDPKLTFQTGLYDGNGTGTGLKAMKHTSTATYVNYDLLLADNTTVITTGYEIPLANDGSSQTITVRGRASGSAGLIDGLYTDTVTVTLTL